MKQQITKKQWDELSDKHKNKLIKFFSLTEMPPNYYIDMGADLSIGQMIEFLGDDFLRIRIGHFAEQKRYFVLTKFLEENEIMSEELADALWEAVKEKLNQ